MMTIHPLHAGDGYLYLTRQVASGDRVRDRTRDLTEYYTDTGTPPGIWMGSGAEKLGLTGEVTEAQMAALFGEGLHPDADAIIAREITAGKTVTQAIVAAKLGASFAEYTTQPSPITDLFDTAVEAFTLAEQRRPSWDERTTLRWNAARTHLTGTLGRAPSNTEIDSALAAQQATSRKAVAGMDCVFTPPKSISILWGLGNEKIREAILRCHREAVRETLAWAESQCAVTRRGRNGVKQIDTDGFLIAAFEHFDNRVGDMNLHTHPVISGKILGVDGKWSALDARPLFASGVSLSCRYNATIVGKIRRQIGFRFEPRARGRGKQPVLEVVGIGDAMITEFSRTPDIIARTEQLVAAYRATHGRNPSTITQYKLAQQATLQTRPGKPLPKALRDMLTEWNDRARIFLGDGRGAIEFIDDLLAEHTGRTPTLFSPDGIAVAVGVDLGGIAGLAAATREDLNTAIDQHLTTCLFDTERERARAHTAVRRLLSRDPPAALLDRIDAAACAHQRTVYEPQPISAEVLETVSRRRATWTEANIRSAVEDRVGLCEFTADDAHRAAVEEITTLVRDQLSLQLTIEPDPIPPAMARRTGESVFTVTGATRYTSQAVLDAENRLLDAATTPTAESIPAHFVEEAIVRIEHTDGLHLDDGQRAIARYLCTNGMLVSVAVGPAGSGKTTAMKAVAAAWHAAGRDVVALAPSASAARQLGTALGIPAKTIATLRTQADYGHRTGLSPGAMILIDEAAMAATADLDAVLALARQHGAIVRCVGDPEQLSAVEAGGIIRTLARDTRAPHLHRLVRFADPDEADATLALRSGKLDKAWEFYNGHGRVTSGMSDELRHAILTAYLTDTAAGISSIMIAATLDNVAALNTGAQAAHAATGRITITGPSVPLSDKHTGYLGDTILTRLNNRALRVTGGTRNGTGIDNGDLWRIHRIHPDGSLTAIGLGHRGTVHLPTDYITDHVELGYATSIHRAQGSTVDHAYVLMDATFGRALAYVGLTRARLLNRIFLATDRLLDITGDQQPDDPTEPINMFAKVLAREDDNLSAIDVMRAEQAATDRRIRTTYTEVSQQLANARGTYLLDRALPIRLFHDTQGSDQFQTLLDTIALAQAHGLDTSELVAAIATNNYQDLGESLADTRDTAAVLRGRADQWINDHLPVAPPAIAIAQTDVLSHLNITDANTMMTNLNDTETLSVSPKRFRALRDPPYRGLCRPVPTPHPGMDTPLAAYATELRRRILSPTADTVLQPTEANTTQDTSTALPPQHATAVIRGETLTTLQEQDSITFIAHLNRAEVLHETTSDAPTITADDPNIAQFGIRERKQRIERWRADYHHYIRQLAEHHADHLLYRALPVLIHHQAQQSFHYGQLLATIALADAHGLDTVSLVAEIATDNHNDLGASLLLTHDPAAELRARADTWIHAHISDASGIRTRLNCQETLPTANASELAHAITKTNIQSDVLYRNPDAGFHALKDLPYTDQFRPIPNYPGRDEALARYAADLRERIAHERQELADLTQKVPPPRTKQPAIKPLSPSDERPNPPNGDSRARAKSRRRDQLKRRPTTSRRTRRAL